MAALIRIKARGYWIWIGVDISHPVTDEDGDVLWGQLLVPVELLALHNRAVNEPSQRFAVT